MNIKEKVLRIRNYLLTRFNLRNLILTLLIPIIIISLFLVQPYRIGASLTTKSINCKAFIWKKIDNESKQSITNGDYICFKLPHMENLKEYKSALKNKSFIKKVGCAPGQFLECDFGVCKCDGRVIVSSVDDRLSHKAFTYYGDIPATHAFLVGDSERSFDGRYWGLTEIATSILGKVEKCLYSAD